MRYFIEVLRRYITVFAGCLSLLICVQQSMLYARAYTVTSADKLGRIIRKHELVAVLFYDKIKGNDLDNIHGIKDTFNSLSRRYDGTVFFAMANVLRERMVEMAKEYGIHETPALVLFDAGRPVRQHGGTRAMLVGFSDRATMKRFIQQYLGDRLDEIRDAEQRARRKKQEKKDVRTSVYRTYYEPYPYYSYPYPYTYQYPYSRQYYGRPYFGFGIGFGSRWW
jgi:thioredoxin-like negative regulator of GroEL